MSAFHRPQFGTKTLTLNCWLRGTNPRNTFEVKITRTENVGALKEAIKDKKQIAFRDVDADSLDLYKPRAPLPAPFEANLSRIILSEHAECLMSAADELSDVFPDALKRHIHIIVDAPILVIVCWLRGSTLDANFGISIRADAIISELKQRIREAHPSLRSVIDEHIRLYRISGDEGEVQGSLNRMADGNPLRGQTLLPNFLDNHTTLLQVGEPDDIPTALTESFKRTTTITSKSLTPSKAAKSNEYAKIQSGSRRLLDCRSAAAKPVNTVAPPIQLFHPAFAYFSSKVFDPEYSVLDDLVLNVRDLVVEFALIRPSEEARRLHLKSILEKIVDHPLTFIYNSDKTAPDVVALSSCGGLPYLIVGEEKNEFGDGGSDPSVQAAFSFLRILSQKENKELCLRCCCPVFVIAHAGPWLTIMGGIFTANCVVQRLTDFLWVPTHSTHDDDQWGRIARVFYALKESIELLDLWYKTINDVTPFDPSVPTQPHPRFFPSPNTYWCDGVPVMFDYQEPLEQNVSCVTYRAKTTGGSPKDIVVKFVTSYGVDVHREMASAGFAPQLLYHGPINGTHGMPSYGKLRMVVMDYVKGLTFDDALKQRELRPRFEDDLHRAFELLHDAGYVFGDLRTPNIIVTPTGTSAVQLIDFDYPVSISRSVKWPQGVRGLASIQKEHDLSMLDSLMRLWP